MKRFHKLCALGVFVASGYVGAMDSFADEKHSMLAPSEISKLDTPERILALPPENISMLYSERIQNILIHNLSKLSFEQACCLSMRDILYNIPTEMIRALPNERIAQMLLRRQFELRGVRREQLQKGVVLSEYADSLSPAQIKALTPEQRTLLVSGYVGAIDSFTNEEHNLLCPPPEICFLYTPEKIFALPPENIPMLNSGQICDIIVPNLNKLSFEQACCLDIRTTLDSISYGVIRALPDRRVAQMLITRHCELRRLENEHFSHGKFLGKHVASLSPAQIEALTPEQVILLFSASPCDLTAGQIRSLDETQMRALKGHYRGWSFIYRQAFNTLQRKAFTTRKAELWLQ